MANKEITKLTKKDKDALTAVGVDSLPNNPSALGMNAYEVKRHFSDPNKLLFSWVERLADETYYNFKAIDDGTFTITHAEMAEKDVDGNPIASTYAKVSKLTSGEYRVPLAQSALSDGNGNNIPSTYARIDTLASGGYQVPASDRANKDGSGNVITETYEVKGNVTANGGENPDSILRQIKIGDKVYSIPAGGDGVVEQYLDVTAYVDLDAMTITQEGYDRLTKAFGDGTLSGVSINVPSVYTIYGALVGYDGNTFYFHAPLVGEQSNVFIGRDLKVSINSDNSITDYSIINKTLSHVALNGKNYDVQYLQYKLEADGQHVTIRNWANYDVQKTLRFLPLPEPPRSGSYSVVANSGVITYEDYKPVEANPADESIDMLNKLKIGNDTFDVIPPIPSDSSSKTYTFRLVNGHLAWVDSKRSINKNGTFYSHNSFRTINVISFTDEEQARINAGEIDVIYGTYAISDTQVLDYYVKWNGTDFESDSMSMNGDGGDTTYKKAFISGDPGDYQLFVDVYTGRLAPALPSDASSKTYTLRSVNRTLTWVDTSVGTQNFEAISVGGVSLDDKISSAINSAITSTLEANY